MQFLTIFRSFLRRELDYAQRNLKANSRNSEFPNVDGTAPGNFQYYGIFDGVRELVTGRQCDINFAGRNWLLLGWDTYQSLYGFAGPGSTTYNCDLFWFRWFGYLPPMAHATTVDEATGQVIVIRQRKDCERHTRILDDGAGEVGGLPIFAHAQLSCIVASHEPHVGCSGVC